MWMHPQDREREETAGPRFRRAFFMAVGLAMLLGLILGAVWIVAGLVHFSMQR